MIPYPDDVLPLWKIAKYWSRELKQVRGRGEIFHELLASFWRDEIHVTGATGKNRVDRQAILKLVNRRRVHPGFSLIDRAGDRPGITKSPSGGILVDITKYVVLPADDTTWTDELLVAAYAEMSKMAFGAFDGLITPGFMAFHITREALREYCMVKGYALPTFWFPTNDDGLRWNGRREREAEAWFKKLVEHPKEKSRPAYLAAAQKQFRGMPEAAFDRIWTKHAPEDWKKSGPVQRNRGRTKR